LHSHFCFSSNFRFGRIVVLVLVIVLFIVLQFETMVKQVGVKIKTQKQRLSMCLTLLSKVNNQFTSSHLTPYVSCSIQDMTVKFQKHTPIEGHFGSVTFSCCQFMTQREQLLSACEVGDDTRYNNS